LPLRRHPSSPPFNLTKHTTRNMQGDYERAEEDLAACLALKPEGALLQEVEAEVALVKRRAKAAVNKQKAAFKNFFER
jgi:hypothetical protein